MDFRGKIYSAFAIIDQNGVVALQLRNYHKFNEYTSRNFLVGMMKVLRKRDPDFHKNCVLLMDNAPFHKGANFREFLAKLRINIIFNSAVSPFLNPIEIVFSWVKNYVRTVNESRDIPLVECIYKGFKYIKAKNCRNAFRDMLKHGLKGVNFEQFN